jgi:hypothetical protein
MRAPGTRRPADRVRTAAAIVLIGGGTAALATAPLRAAVASPQAARPAPVSAGQPTRYLPDEFAGRAGRYYRLVWGVDDMSLRLAESGAMIRFTYRVLDPAKAALLNDIRAQPALVDPRAGVSLVVPFMDMIGVLREHPTPEAGKVYWMAFANTGHPVKRGDRVNVVIGQFRAEGMVVR